MNEENKAYGALNYALTIDGKDREIIPIFLFERYKKLPEKVEVLDQHKIRGDKRLFLDLGHSSYSCPLDGNKLCLLHYREDENTKCCGYYHQVYVQGEHHYVLFKLTRKKVPHVKYFFRNIQELLNLN